MLSKEARQQILGQVFTPASPITKRELFAGRLPELGQIFEGVKETGQHVVLFGERGVGKTSLANIINESFGQIYPAIYIKVNCNSADNHHELWRKICRRIVLVSEDRTMGFISDKITKPIQLDAFLEANKDLKSDDIVYIFQIINHPAVIILDEFDRLPKGKDRRLVADTIKALSDNIPFATIIIVGVGENVSELIGKHASIERCLKQIKLPKMSPAEIIEVLDKGLNKLEMKAEEPFRDNLVRFSNGFPHYAHLISKYAVDSAIEQDREIVNMLDFQNAIRNSIANAQESLRLAYQSAIMSSHRGTLYEPILYSCVLASVDENDSFRASDLKEPLERLLQKKFELRQFIKPLSRLTERERGPILTRIGPKNRRRYKFTNPLMKAYVLMRAYEQGILT